MKICNKKCRVPLLKHEKALVISTTFFGEENFKADWEAPMSRIIDDWGLRYPGVKQVEHGYFQAVPIVDDEVRRGYLQQAYRLGLEFAQSWRWDSTNSSLERSYSHASESSF